MSGKKAEARVPDDFHGMPGYLLRRMQQISTALFAEECVAHKLTAVQYAALSAIGSNPLIDATRLSGLVSLDRSTLGGVLERIEGKGWVSRSSNPNDRRVKLLSLTKEGHKKVAEVAEAVAHVQKRLLDPLTHAERRQLTSLLMAITEAHQEIPPTKDLSPTSETSID